ncbi:MAG TPA: hypothetical protein VIX84_01405, partial [Acidimicrobiales bacterium]
MGVTEPLGRSLQTPETVRRSDIEAGPRVLSVATAAAEDPKYAIPPVVGGPPASRYRSITDRELTLMQVCNDFVCACIALALSLVILSQVSTAGTNDVSQIGHSIEIDTLFPVAVVIALALGGVYRTTHRSLQPSAFLEIRELCFGVGAGCVLTLAAGSLLHGAFGTTEPIATQLVMAVTVTIGVITMGRIVLRYLLHALTTTRVLVVGAGLMAERIMFSVQQDPGMTLVGRAVDGIAADAGAIGRVADLPALCRQLDVHRIPVAPSDRFS